jgi:hypothetical protein
VDDSRELAAAHHLRAPATATATAGFQAATSKRTVVIR